MSASNKKKLRKEQEAGALTEKQLSARKEAKKTKAYTIAFAACMAVLVIVAVVFGVRQFINNTGVREKATTALTVGSHKLSNAELSYYYMDTVNNFISTYGSYASLFGLDTTVALDEQVYDEESGETWADSFLEAAESNAQAVYALCDAAEEAGYTLPEDEQDEIDSTISSIDTYATLYGYSGADAYLKAIYGSGASVSGYRDYCEHNALASAYESYYSESLTYTDEDLRAAESENYDAYSSFDYNTYYLSVSRFLTGGTTDEDGNTTYSDEERAAAVEAAEAAATELTSGEYASADEFNDAVAALEINADTTASSTSSRDVLYSSVSSSYVDWVSDSSREEGDMTYIASTSTSTDDDGNETTTTNGYYVVYYVGRDDNEFTLSNVRHILVAFEGGTTDDNGDTTYSDEEKEAAKTEAESILEEWESGDATEESFAELANSKSDDGDGTTGGLYEDIGPDSSYVTNFLEWAIDDHEPGDTGIIETEYGYHVMYYSGDTTYTYRDKMIEDDLRSADTDTWYDSLVEATEMTVGNTSYIQKSLVIGSLS